MIFYDRWNNKQFNLRFKYYLFTVRNGYCENVVIIIIIVIVITVIVVIIIVIIDNINNRNDNLNRDTNE